MSPSVRLQVNECIRKHGGAVEEQKRKEQNERSQCDKRHRVGLQQPAQLQIHKYHPTAVRHQGNHTTASTPTTFPLFLWCLPSFRTYWLSFECLADGSLIAWARHENGHQGSHTTHNVDNASARKVLQPGSKGVKLAPQNAYLNFCGATLAFWALALQAKRNKHRPRVKQ